jgi:hypothetical protein
MHHLYWSDPFEQHIQLQILNIELPLAWFRKRYPPASVFHLFQKYCGLVRRVFHVRGANGECCKVKHNPRELGIDVMLDVVLPGVGGRRSIES